MIDNKKILSNPQVKSLITESTQPREPMEDYENQFKNVVDSSQDVQKKEIIKNIRLNDEKIEYNYSGEIIQLQCPIYNPYNVSNPNLVEKDKLLTPLLENLNTNKIEIINSSKQIVMNQGNIQKIFVSNNFNYNQDPPRNNEKNQYNQIILKDLGIESLADPDSVIKKYEKMGLSQPQIFYNMNIISEYLSNCSEFLQATKFYEKLISLNPDNANTYIALGHCYTIQGENKKALNSYKSGLNLLKDVKDDQLWFGIAECCEKMKQIVISLLSCEFILTFTQSKSVLANAYLKLGKYLFLYSYFDTALEYLNKTLLLKDMLSINRLIETYLLFGNLYHAKKDYINAILFFKRALRIDQNNIKIILQISWIFFLQGDYTESNENLEKAKQLNLNCGDIYYIESRILLSQNKVKEAFHQIKYALSINKDNPLYSCNLGIIHTIISEFREAFNDFSICLHSKDYIFEGLYNLGLLYEISNQPLEAIIAYENALNYSSDNEPCQRRLDILKCKNIHRMNIPKNEALINLMRHPNFYIFETMIPTSNKSIKNELKDVIENTLEISKPFTTDVVIKYLNSYFKIQESSFKNHQPPNLNLTSNFDCRNSANMIQPQTHINQDNSIQNNQDNDYYNQLLNRISKQRDFERNMISNTYSQNKMMEYNELLNSRESNNIVNCEFPLQSIYSNGILSNNTNNFTENQLSNKIFGDYSNPYFQFNPNTNQANISNLSQTKYQHANPLCNIKFPSFSNFSVHHPSNRSETYQENISNNFSSIFMPQNNILSKEITNHQTQEAFVSKPEPLMNLNIDNEKKQIIENHDPENIGFKSNDITKKFLISKSPNTQESKSDQFNTPVKPVPPSARLTPEGKEYDLGKLQKQRLLELSRVADTFQLDTLNDKK